MSIACEHLEDPDWEAMEGAVLIAGDAADVGAIARVASRLPWDAHGVILIEAAARIQFRHIDVPRGLGPLAPARRGAARPCPRRASRERRLRVVPGVDVQ